MTAEVFSDLSIATDANDDPIPLATWNFFLTGTSTPHAVYANALLSVSLGSVVTADGDGRFVPIFFDAAVIYRAVLKDAGGVDIVEIDPVNGALAGIMSDLASTTPGEGSGLIGYSGGTTVEAELDAINLTVAAEAAKDMFYHLVNDGGALFDGLTDDTTAIQNSIDLIGAAGGGIIIAPRGTAIVGALTMKENIRLLGEGHGSVFESAHVGDGLTMTSTINTSNAVNTSVENLRFHNTNGANTGAGYDDMTGTFVNLFNVRVTGFKHGVIFDQTELGTIRQCQFDGQLAGGSGVWLVGNDEHRATAAGQFTNRINIEECQFNEAAGVHGVIDDGGLVHSYRNNNFNQCESHLRAAGVLGLLFESNECEGSNASMLRFDALSAAGNGVGGCTNITVRNNLLAPATGQTIFDCVNGPSTLIAENNYVATSAGIPIFTGLVNVARFIDLGNQNQGLGDYGTINPGTQFRDQYTGSFTPTVSFSTGNTGITYSSRSGIYTRIGNLVFCTINITLSSKGSSTGVLRVGGLPFTVNTAYGANQWLAPAYMNNTTDPTAAMPYAVYSTTFMEFYMNAVSAGNNIIDTHIANNTAIFMSICYLTE